MRQKQTVWLEKAVFLLLLAIFIGGNVETLGRVVAGNSAASDIVDQPYCDPPYQPLSNDFLIASTGLPAAWLQVARLLGELRHTPPYCHPNVGPDLVLEPNAPDGGVLILTNDVERMRITPDGHTGLGISNPESLLDVQANAEDEIITRFGRDNFGTFESLIEIRTAKSIITSGNEIGRGSIRLRDTIASPNRVMELGYYEYGGGLFTDNLFEFWTSGVSIASHTREPFLAVRDMNDRYDIRLRHDGIQGFIETTGPDVSEIQIGGNGSNGQITLATRFGATMVLTDEGNVGVGTTPHFGAGSGVVAIADATTTPIENPIGGGFLYVDDGVLKYRGPLGTVTTIAAP